MIFAISFQDLILSMYNDIFKDLVYVIFMLAVRKLLFFVFRVWGSWLLSMLPVEKNETFMPDAWFVENICNTYPRDMVNVLKF